MPQSAPAMRLTPRFDWQKVSMHLVHQRHSLGLVRLPIVLPPPEIIAGGLYTSDRKKADLETASQIHDAALDAAIAAHTLELEAATLEGAAREWLFARVYTAATHAHNLASLGNEQWLEVFPNPQTEMKETVGFLLRNWWYEKGFAFYCKFLA